MEGPHPDGSRRPDDRRAGPARVERHRHRRVVRAPSARAASDRGPGVRRRVREEPRVHQGDGAALRRELPHHQEPAQPPVAGPRHRPRRRDGAGDEPRGRPRPPRARRDHRPRGGGGAAPMKLPPLVARVRVRTDRRSLGLWVPLFLAWALLVVLLAPLLLLALLVTLLFAPRWRFARLASGVYAAVCE